MVQHSRSIPLQGRECVAKTMSGVRSDTLSILSRSQKTQVYVFTRSIHFLRARRVGSIHFWRGKSSLRHFSRVAHQGLHAVWPSTGCIHPVNYTLSIASQSIPPKSTSECKMYTLSKHSCILLLSRACEASRAEYTQTKKMSSTHTRLR